MEYFVVLGIILDMEALLNKANKFSEIFRN
jgi:hypothetical protein